MSRVDEIHYKAVIAADNQEPPKDYCISAHADHFNGFVEGFTEGYAQAEKDVGEKTAEWLTKHAAKYFDSSRGVLGTEELVEDYKLIVSM